MLKNVTILLVLLVAAGTTVAHGADAVLIGYIDRDAVFATDKVKSQIDKLDMDRKSRESDLQKKFDVYMEQLDAYKKKQDFMGEEEKAAAQEELAKSRGELLEFRSTQSKELDTAREEVRKKVLAEAKGIIASVAREKGYTIVLWKDSLAYGPPEYDLTAEVLKRFTEGGN